jgi:hypothetical protein
MVFVSSATFTNHKSKKFKTLKNSYLDVHQGGFESIAVCKFYGSDPNFSNIGDSKS